MARLKKKLQIVTNLYETTNENRIKTGGTLDMYVYPAGAELNTVVTTGSGEKTVFCSGRGALSVGQKVHFLRPSTTGDQTSWAEQHTGSAEIISIEEVGNSEGVFAFVVDFADLDETLQTGDRMVSARIAGQLVTLYQDPAEEDDTISNNPVDVPQSGVFGCFVKERAVDVYYTGDSIDAGWYLFDVPAGTGELGPIRLVDETVTEAVTVNVDADTSLALVEAGTSPIQAIEHCAPGRMLLVMPTEAGVQLTTTSTRADNTIYEASSRTIDLSRDVAVMLKGVSASANTAYWVPVGSLRAVDQSLNELSDVDTSAATENAVLAYDGSSWAAVTTLGSDSTPLAAAHVGLLAVGSGADKATITYSGSVDQALALPDVGGSTATLLATLGAQTITGVKTFDDEAMVLRDPVATTAKARFDLGSVSAGTTVVMTIPDQAAFTVARADQIPTEIADLDDVGASSTPSAGSPLVYDGSDWDQGGWSSNSIGSSSNPQRIWLTAGAGLSFVDVTDSTATRQVQMNDLTGTIDSSAKTYYVPDADTNSFFVMSQRNRKFVTYGGLTGGDSDTAGLITRLNSAGGGANGVALLYTNYPLTLKRIIFDIIALAAVGTANGYTFQLYYDSAIPTASTIPPSGATAILNSAVAIPAGNSSTKVDTTSFAESTIPANNYLFLGLAASGTMPDANNWLNLSIEYDDSFIY